MGRAHEVRAASMAKTAAAKSKLNNKWSRIIYMAAKNGVPDPDLNQNLKKEIEKAVLSKPMEHKFSCQYGTSHGMNTIGG